MFVSFCYLSDPFHSCLGCVFVDIDMLRFGRGKASGLHARFTDLMNETEADRD